MERDLKIDLQDAIKWYNGSNKELRDLALKTFSKSELENSQWSNIKTWKDVLNALHIFKDYTELLPFKACYAARVQMIRIALNEGYDMKLWEGKIWYPYCIMGPEDNVKCRSNYNCGKVVVYESQPESENKSLFVGGNTLIGSYAGLGCFFFSDDVGCSGTLCGVLGCATKEIAEHFGKYFYYEILASCYGDKIRKIEEND